MTSHLILALSLLVTLSAATPPQQDPDLARRTREYFAALDKRDTATVERHVDGRNRTHAHG